nr:succinate dehydrogenase subunit 2 [Stylonema alsidii]
MLILRYLPNQLLPSLLAYPTPSPNTPLLTSLLTLRSSSDPTLALRYSCREGICGSCPLSLNHQPLLACLHTPRPSLPPTIYPLPFSTLQRDLILSLHAFTALPSSPRQPLASPSMPSASLYYHRLLLETHYECILCGCCSYSCPSYWWHHPSYHGPAAILASLRSYLTPSSLTSTAYPSLSLCHRILHCSRLCPKRLNPSAAILLLSLLSS